MSKTVLISSIMHETNTFSVQLTGLDAFARRYDYRGDAVPKAFRGTSTEMGAFLAAADQYGWQLRHPVAAAATPAGKVTQEAWNTLSQALLAALDGGVDGVLLALHGAMVTEAADDAEGELLERIRAKIGPEIPIAITLDLHANVTDKMARHANIIVAYRTYPHVDQHARGLQAASLMQRAMAGEIKPRTVVARRATLDGVDHGRTTTPGPMTEMLEHADRCEKEPGLLVVSVHAGFGWADIADAGPSVSVTGDGDDPKFRTIANSLMDEVWRTRRQSSVTFYSVDEAMEVAEMPDRSGKPLVLADATDNPGGGGYGDATNLLAGMLRSRLTNAAFAPISDPEAVAECIAAGEGARLTLTIGGKIDPTYGPPIQVIGTVRHIGDGDYICDGPMWKGLKMSMGKCAVLRVGGVDIVLASSRFQITDPQQFLSVGIDPLKKSVIGLKSSQHFRAAYGPMARRVLIVNSGALTTPDYTKFTYKKLRRPIWPLDEIPE